MLNSDLREARCWTRATWRLKVEVILDRRVQRQPTILNEPMHREGDNHLATARLTEVRRRLYGGVAGFGERIAASIDQSAIAHQRERRAADAMTLHRVAHRSV